MAYNLMIEFPKSPNWQQLSLVASDCRFVEVFPIDGDDGDLPAVGVCLSTKGVTPDRWLELKQLLDLLRTHFSGRVFDLYSGKEIGPEADETIRQALFG